MVKPNYSAWHVDVTAFSDAWTDRDKLEFFARFAILAPSGHNTQPWQMVTKKGSVFVSINPDHHLSIDGSGLLSVEPYISLGTFLEVFNLAARGFGYGLTIDLFPDEQFVASVSLGKKTPADSQLVPAILNRVSNRHPFEKTVIDPVILSDIITHDLPGVEATLVTNHKDIEFVAGETETAIGAIMGNPSYRRELSLWVRTNHTRKFDGMPGFTHGFGMFKSLLSKTAVRHAPSQGPQAKKSGKLIRNSGALVVVRCSSDSKESFINAGRLYSYICVNAQKAGIASSALGAAVLDPTTRESIKRRFGINDRPIYILRLGKSVTKSRHSPRWPLEKVLNRATG